ncbi:hypothetical protein [Rhodoferax ferrireducens]|uniref:hypothetical protein n=1 Tax=Rhodoferax ferrireducens TaxID=192843 RepID=UPI0002E47DB2|nr:hypothetical protein [Rhodoferax ferrireducens]
MKLLKYIEKLQAAYDAYGDVEGVCIEGGPTLDPTQVVITDFHLVIVTEANGDTPCGVEAPYFLIGQPSD